MSKYIAKFIISPTRSYTMDISVERIQPEPHDFSMNPTVCNELNRRNDITSVEFYRAVPDFTLSFQENN